MRKSKAAFLISILIASTVTLTQSAYAEENKTHNVDIIFGSANVENSRFYNPSIVKIKINDSVSWMNLDKDPHTVTDGSPQSKWGTVFDSGLMKQGKVFNFKFTKPGEYPYLCALHPWMMGRVIVEDPVANSVPSGDISVLQKLNVFIKSEKQSYEQDEIIRFTIEVMGVGNKPTDPDEIDAIFGVEEPKPVTLSRIDVGKYAYSTAELKPASYNLSVKVSKENFASGSSMLTIHVLKKELVTEIPKSEPTLSIKSDQQQYYSGDMVTINGSTSNAIENKSIVLQVFDPTNKLQTRGQVLANSEGLFQWSFKVPDTAIAGMWTVRTKNYDEIATASFEIKSMSDITESVSNEPVKPEPLVSVPVMKFKNEKVTIVQAAITDQINSQLYDVHRGQSVMIQSIIKNNQETEQTFAYIAQIKDSNGVIVKLEVVEGTIPAGKSFTVGVSWTPEQADSYSTEVFVWKSLSEPIPLSLNLPNTEVNVTD
jgi:plastocyanin